ncbi:LPS-assembly protein LptD [Thermodesulfobacteriota bacterium]
MTKLLPRLSVLILFFFIFPSLIISVPVASNADESSSAAQKVATEEWDISADKIIRYENPESIVAEGNIVLIKRKKTPPKPPGAEDGVEGVTDWSILLEEGQPEVEATPESLDTEQEPVFEDQIIIKADWMTYDVVLNTIKARGNVSVEADDQSIIAEQAVVNLEQETGTFKKATILGNEKDLHLEAEVIEKVGFKTYHIKDGWIITCKIPEGKKAPWSFAASDVIIEQDGYAKLKHARFRIKDVPVFYSPFLFVPAKNKRETGFLLPELSTAENSGFGFNLPFFWNISDSTDLTIYTQYFANRGYMPGVEFRYITDPNDKGLLMANYLYDDLSDPSETEYYEDTGYTHDNKDRYWFRGKADQDFGPSWTSRLDLDIVSDRDYLREFNTGLTGFINSNDQYLDTFGRSLENKTDDQRTNRFSLQRSWGSTSLEAKLLGINDVRSDDAKFDDEGNELPTPLWNLPTIDYTGTVPFENLWDMTLQWDTDYANFWREEGIGGHRFDLYPTLSAPLPISPYLESRAEVGLRDTYYIVQEYGDAQWDESDSQNRLLFDVKAELGTTLMRTFAMSGKSMTGLTHQVRPYVEYDYLPDVDQDDLPSFDGVDRVAEQNQFAYGIDNFFNALSGDNTDRDYGWFKIRQDYSFIDARSDEPFSDVNLDLKWIPVQFLEFWYKTDYDVYDNIFALHDLEGTYRTRRGDFFKLEYYFKDNGELNDTNQINGIIDAALFSSLRARFSIEHSIANEETNEANLALLYQALCWSVELGSQYTPEETKFMLIFSLANLGSPLKFYY